jgi:hypothetical protein
MMKNLFFIIIVVSFIISCTTSRTISAEKQTNFQKSDTVRIANDELEYEVIIIDGGFTSWLNSMARPRGFYTENFLETRNRIYVTEWNRRSLQFYSHKPNLYEMQINYDMNTHYGYEVNYLIYNYFIYFQLKHKEQLAGFVPGP